MSHPLLLEIQRFAIGKNAFHREESQEATLTLVKKSLKLLEELPVLRDSIFDYYSMVFEVSIAGYIKQEKNIHSAQKNENPDQAIMMIKEGLEKLLIQQSWAATYVSQWSLSSLIKPSVEYAKMLNLDFKSACTLWLGCNGMRCLLDLCGLCFGKFDDVETKRYIYDLENVFADNRPNFDWCVAHLSSLFPLKFISNILRMPSMLTPAFISSTVTVLEYLSSTNEQSLNILLLELIEEALNADQNDLKSKDYIPNLIQLASRSEIYAQAVLNVFLDFMEKGSEQFIDKLKRQALTRPLDYNPDKLQSILPELILRTKENGTKLLLLLADLFYDNGWCMELLELVMTELQSLVFNDKNCPLYNDIRRDSTWELLWSACKSDKAILQQTAVRLILTSSSERYPMLYYKTIEELITTNSAKDRNALNALVRVLDDPIGINDVPDAKVAISHTIQKLSINVEKSQRNECYYVIRNLVDLVTIEKSGQCQFLKRSVITSAMQHSIRMIIHIWEILLRKVMPEVESAVLTNDDSGETTNKKMKLNDCDDPMEIADLEEERVYTTKDQIHMITQLLDLLLIVGALNMSEAIRCERLTVKYFFWCLTETDEIARSIITDRCFSLLSKQCSGRKGIRSAALKDLLEGALFLYPNLFGASLHVAAKSHIYHKKDESLLKLNQKQGISLNVSRSSILHSGVIGCGVPKIEVSWAPEGLNGQIKNIFMKAIVACCSCQDENAAKSSIEGFCQVSQLLIELISADVMYNGIAWPEEEFTKVTMERDLLIRRTFKNCPILWSIMGLLAVHKQPLINCSVFLRAICASVMHHWRAKSTETISGSNTELMFFTVKLLELLSLGQLLPPPLSYLYIVVQHLEPNEIAYVLKECVWNYMVAHGPYVFNIEGFEIPQPQQRGVVADHFLDPLRNTMQKKLSTLGNLYYQMFILSPAGNN